MVYFPGAVLPPEATLQYLKTFLFPRDAVKHPSMHKGINNSSGPSVYRDEFGPSGVYQAGLHFWKAQKAAVAGACGRHVNVPRTLFLKGLCLSDSNRKMRK